MCETIVNYITVKHLDNEHRNFMFKLETFVKHEAPIRAKIFLDELQA